MTSLPIAIVPVTVMNPNAVRQIPTDVPFHPTYDGAVLFKNTFDGKLPAADYPKVNVRSPYYLRGHACKRPAVLPRNVFPLHIIWFGLGVQLLQASFGTPSYSGA